MPRGGAKPGERRGGRQKGTPNKRTKAFQEALRDYKCSIPKHVAELLAKTDDAFPPHLKAEFMHKVLPYLYPQRKPIDPDGYLSVEQVAGLLGGQVEMFRQALQQHITDPGIIANVMADLRAGP